MNMGKSVIEFNEKKGFICDMDGVEAGSFFSYYNSVIYLYLLLFL